MGDSFTREQKGYGANVLLVIEPDGGYGVSVEIEPSKFSWERMQFEIDWADVPQLAADLMRWHAAHMEGGNG